MNLEQQGAIVVFGAGYVGLVLAACFARSGNWVTVVDRDESKIDSLKCNRVPFFEPGLSEIVQSQQSQGVLKFTTDVQQELRDAGIVFVAVGLESDVLSDPAF